MRGAIPPLPQYVMTCLN